MNPDSADGLENAEAIDDLLDEIWFFDNLLLPRTRVLRYCHSDPYPSSNHIQTNHPNTATPTAIGSLSEEHSSSDRRLVRAPSLPPYIERGETERKEVSSKRIEKMRRQFSEKISLQEPKSLSLSKQELIQGRAKDNVRRRSKPTSQSTKRGLQRTQTLPSNIGREDADVIPDQESDTRLSFLIREAVASSSEITPPRQASKAKVQFSNTPRKPPRNPDAESTNRNLVRRQYPNGRKLRKTVSNLESEEIRGINDLGFEFEKQDKEKMIPHLPEAWLSRSIAPPIPAYVAKDSTSDVKDQIKFWARAVASNVR